MESKDLQTLGAIIDDTFTSNYEGVGTFRTVGKLHGDSTLKVSCMSVVNLLNRSDMKKQSDQAYSELATVCNEYMKRIKKEFREIAGRALKTKEQNVDESVELMRVSSYSPTGTALVRCIYTFEVS